MAHAFSSAHDVFLLFYLVSPLLYLVKRQTLCTHQLTVSERIGDVIAEHDALVALEFYVYAGIIDKVPLNLGRCISTLSLIFLYIVI